MYRVQYIREPWSEVYECDAPEDGVLGDFTWEEMQDNVTNGDHGSGWAPGRYRLTFVQKGPVYPGQEREAEFDIVIGGGSLSDTVIYERLRNISPDMLMEWLEGAFAGDTAKIIADCLERGKDRPGRQRRAAAGE